jgi:hypothetical protein
MTCRFPVVDIPPEFLPSLDSLVYSPLLPSDAYKDNTLPMDVSNCTQYQQPPGTELPQISFNVGFLLDGVTDFVDMGGINVFPPPNVCFNDSMITYRSNVMTLTVRYIHIHATYGTF